MGSRRLGAVAVSIALAVSTAAIVSAPEAGAASCISSNRNLFDGYLSTDHDPSSGLTFEGASANIINNPTVLCGFTDPKFNFSYVWVMIAQNQSAATRRVCTDGLLSRLWTMHLLR